MSEFSAEFELSIDRHWDMRFMHYEVSEMSFNSEMEHLYECVDLPYSLELDEYDEFSALEDGEYHVYVRGEGEFVSDVDWESGVEEGCFVLSIEKISIDKLEIDKNE